MFDRAFFETSFNDHVAAKRKFSGDGSVSVRFHLSTGEILTIWNIEEATDGCLVVEPFPRRGAARPHGKEERAQGAPLFDLDRMAITYEAILEVEITTARPRGNKLGFRGSNSAR